MSPFKGPCTGKPASVRRTAIHKRKKFAEDPVKMSIYLRTGIAPEKIIFVGEPSSSGEIVSGLARSGVVAKQAFV